MKYRPEVDGLRAIAVVSVIIYHAEFFAFGREWLTGGYIGVDIFFVISGYLITKIILTELFERGRFSFAKFYERRVRRILPMLFTVMLVAFPFAWITILPTAFVEYSWSVISAVFFCSNFFFYFSTTEYGADNALLMPFLHTWSLGIEEQFYIFFPIIMIVAFRFLKDRLAELMIVLLLGSLAFSELMSGRNPDLNFFLPMSRFWELLVGSLLAYAELKRGRLNKNTVLSNVLPVLGMVMILWAIVAFDAETAHPGFITLIPVLGVATIIALSSTEDVTGRLLGTKPFVGIGLISYSAYLWHFPVFAFSRLSDATPSNTDKVWWIVVTFVLSVISYFLIERPFRNRSLVKLPMLLSVLGLMLAAVLALSFYTIYRGGFEDRFETIEGALHFERDNQKLKLLSRVPSDDRWNTNPDFDDSKIGVLIVGNSHGKDMYNVFSQNADLYPEFDFLRGKITQLSCFDTNVEGNRQYADKFFSTQGYKDAKIIVVSTQYKVDHCDNKNQQIGKGSDVDGLPILVERAKADGKGVLIFGGNVIIRSKNQKLIADVELDKLGSKAADLSKSQTAVDRFIRSVNRKAYANRNLEAVSGTNEKVSAIAKSLSVPYVDKAKFVCVEEERICYAVTPDGYKGYFDNSHYTLEGAKFFGQRMSEAGMRDLLLGLAKPQAE